MSPPAPTGLSVQQILTHNSMTPMLHPPCSPSVTPSDFFLFPWMKKVLKKEGFADVEEVKKENGRSIKGIKIDDFKNCFEQLKKSLDRYIASSGQYFEGD